MRKVSGEYIAPMLFTGIGEFINPTGDKLEIPPESGGTIFVSVVNGYSNSVLASAAATLGGYIRRHSNSRLIQGEGNFHIEPPAERITNTVTVRGFRRADGKPDVHGFVVYKDPEATLFVQGIHEVPFTEAQALQVERACELHFDRGIRLSENRTGVVFPEAAILEVVTIYDRREPQKPNEKIVTVNSPYL